MKSHIIYIPGLGDGYDPIRKLGLKFWRRPSVVVTHIPVRWSSPDETYEQKLARIETVVMSRPGYQTVLVGESAGGAMAIAAAAAFPDHVARIVTVCGMNQGAGNVSTHLYRKNPAFRNAMVEADAVTSGRHGFDKSRMSIIYSSRDFTVRPKDTLIAGVTAIDLKTPGHMAAILNVLYRRSKLVLDLVSR